MKYEEHKKKHSEARQKLNDAKIKLDELEAEKESLMQDFEQSYETLTDARAKQSIGEGSPDSVSKAEKRNKDFKQQIEDSKLNIDVQSKAVKLLETKFHEVDSTFKQQATDYFRNQSKPLFNNLTEALQKADKAIQDVNELARMAEREGVTIQTKGINRQSEILISKQRPAGTLALSTINLNQLQK